MRSKLLICTVLLVLGSLAFTGCVRRRMSVISNPPGATVYMDSKMIGRTPFSYNFDHYGKREFRLVKEGYETKTKLMPLRSPWYQLPGVDFITEVLLPGKLTDRPHLEFDLEPIRMVESDRLVIRAEDFRRLAHAEGIVQIQDRGAAPAAPTGGSIGPGPINPPSSTPYGASPYDPTPVAVPPAYSPGPAPATGATVYPVPSVSPPVRNPSSHSYSGF